MPKADTGPPFKVYPERKARRKILPAEVRKESGRGKGRLTIRDLFADARRSQAELNFLATTDVGRLVPAEGDAGSEVSEWESRERGEERRAEAEMLGAGEKLPLFLPTASFMASADEV